MLFESTSNFSREAKAESSPPRKIVKDKKLLRSKLSALANSLESCLLLLPSALFANAAAS